jgi:tRNA(fMet)-specific endonuclease VapC
MNYLLDTNVISELISKQPDKKVVDWLDRLDLNAVYLSVITIGIRKVLKTSRSKRKVRSENGLKRTCCSDSRKLNTKVMLVWGALTGPRKRRRPITALTAHAIALQGGCVTRNELDFQNTE